MNTRRGVHMNRIASKIVFTVAVATLAVTALAQSTKVTVRESTNRNMAEMQAEAYDGPKARIAVARFENKTADSYRWYSPEIGDGMADMLTTALVNTGRYIVLERESLDTVLTEQDLGASGRIRQDTAAAIGEIEGAELLVVAAVTEFEGNSGGTRGGLGGIGGGVLGAIAGGTRKAHMAIDLRVVDARTSRILAATSVEGEARDFNVGGALGGFTGSVGLGGALQTWKNTPREKALRAVIEGAVDYVISVTPAEMLRHGGNSQATAAGPASGYEAGPAAASGDRVVITANTASAHQGPNGSTPEAFSLAAGTIVEAVLRAGDWIQVRDDQGRTGWVKAADTLAVQ